MKLNENYTLSFYVELLMHDMVFSSSKNDYIFYIVLKNTVEQVDAIYIY